MSDRQTMVHSHPFPYSDSWSCLENTLVYHLRSWDWLPGGGVCFLVPWRPSKTRETKRSRGVCLLLEGVLSLTAQGFPRVNKDD